MKGEMLGKMIVMATVAHSGQFDKGGEPYILHCLAVMGLLGDADEELRCIAVGHDIVEDTKITYKDLENAGFSQRVISGIKTLTKQRGQTYEEYQEGVFSSVDAMRVKLADLQHNSDIRRLKGVTDKDIERIKKYHKFYTEIQSRLLSCKT